MLLSNIIISRIDLCVHPKRQTDPSSSWFLFPSFISNKSFYPSVLEATFTRQHIRNVSFSTLSGWREQGILKCLNRWLPRSLEVKIKTCAWGLRAQNAIYSSSLISSGIPAWGLAVLEAHAHLAKNNSQMVIYNFELCYNMKAFHCEQCCKC